MNSVILNAFLTMGRYVRRLFINSTLYRIICAVHSFFSKSWKNSSVLSFLRKNERVGMSGKSVFYNVAHFPFLLFEFINETCGKKISAAFDDSVILSAIKSYVSELLMLDSRVFGALLLSWSSAFMLNAEAFSIIAGAIGVLGVVLLIVDAKIINFVKNSAVVRFAFSLFGFSVPEFDFGRKIKYKRIISVAISFLLGILLGLLPIRLAVVGFVGVVGVTIILMYPLIGVFISVFAAPFVPTMVLAGLCIVTFVSLIIRSLCEEGFKWNFDGLGNALVVFLVFMLFSCLLSFAPEKSIMVWAMYLVFVSFYFVIINTIKSKEQMVAILKVFVIAGVIVSLYGVMQYAFGWTNSQNAWIDEEMFEEAVVRVDSTMENPNVLGEFLLLYLPIAAVFMIKEKWSKFSKYVFAGSFAVGCLCMVLTQSRGCWLGLILSVAIFITFYKGKLWALLPLGLLALPFILPDTVIARIMSIGNLEDSSTSYRVFIWRGTFKMMKDFWLGGIGMGECAFRLVYPLYSYNGIIAPHAHNTFLQLLVEGGIGALAIFITIMAVFIKKISVYFRETQKGGTLNLLALAIGSGVIGFLMQSIFDYTFYNYRMMAMFFMIIAIGMSFKNIREDVNEENY